MPSRSSGKVDERPVINLQSERLSLAYRRRLRSSLEVLQEWCLVRGVKLEEVMKKEKELNRILIEFVQSVYDQKMAY